MKVEEKDIESIFGKSNKIYLFSEDEYQPLLQQILSTPSYSYDKSKLPFGTNVLFHMDDSFSDKMQACSKAKISDILTCIVNPILNYKIKRNTVPKNTTDRHVFIINEPGICWAYGMYDVKTNVFYILKGSRFAKKTSLKHSAASSAATRLKLINRACVEKNDFYVVTHDYKCRSAKSAASVVMGRAAHYAYWKDKDGRLLAEVYPQSFFDRTVLSDSIQVNLDVKK